MALEGTLHDMSLSDLFQIFLQGQKSGILLLSRGLEQGAVFVRDGQLVDAEVRRAGDPAAHAAGEAAVLQLLRWPDASFIFQYDPAVLTRPATITQSAGWLVLAAGRDEPPARPGGAGITHATIVEAGASAERTEVWMGLDLDQWRILEQVRGRTPVQTIARNLSLPLERALALVHELVATGLVRVASPPAAPAQPAPRSAAGRVRSALLQAIQRRVRAL